MGHVGIEPIREGPDEVPGLGHIGGVHELLLGGIFPAVPQVVGDGTGEEPSLLLDIGQVVSEELLGHLPDVRAVEQQGALCGVMEPKD